MAVTAIAGLALSAVSTGFQVSQANKAAKLQKQRNAIETEQRLAAERREQLKLMREARQRRASLINLGAQTGLVGSSSLAGADQSIETARQRESDFVSQNSALATRADAITNAQIKLNTQNQVIGYLTNIPNSIQSFTSDTNKTLNSLSNIVNGNV